MSSRRKKRYKQGKAFLLILAEDASANTAKKFRNMCAYYRVPLVSFLDKEDLGRAVGRDYRACLAVLDENLAREIRQQLTQQVK